MKKIIVSRLGSPEVLESREAAIPQPESDEVVIKVAFAGVGTIDAIMRAGKLREFNLQPPFTPGIEISGIVHSVGDNVEQFAIGQAVAAIMPPDGGYAEYVRAKQSLTTRLRSVKQLRAAASLVNLTTAYLLFTDIARLQPEDLLVIHGASGGIGTACIQVARLLQPQSLVVATVRQPNKKPYVQSLGCKDVITVDSFLRGSNAENVYSLIVDPVGGDLRRASITALKPYGRLLAIGNVSNDYETVVSSQQLWLEGKTISGFNLALYAKLYPDQVQLAMKFIAGRLEDERLALKEKLFSLSEVRQAHTYLQSGALTGRVLLEINDVTLT